MPSYLITDQLNFVGVASDAGLVDDIMHEALLGTGLITLLMGYHDYAM